MDSYKTKDVQLEHIMPLMREQLAAGKTVQIAPKGTSMLPMLRQGIDQVVLTAVQGRLKKYDLPLYQRENGQFVLHRIVKAEETYACVGDNQFELEQGLRQEQMIGVVTAFYRGKKEYQVTDLSYRIYCRFWHASRPVRQFWRRGLDWLRRHFK